MNESPPKNNPLWFMGIDQPRSVGYYSGTKRDFPQELLSEEFIHGLPIEDYLPNKPDSIYNDPDFREEVIDQWNKLITSAKEDFTQYITICAIAQSHIDIAWKWRLGQSIKKACTTFGNAVHHMEHYLDFTFAGSQPALYEMVMHQNPGLFEKIKQKVTKGQFELVGACWTEPDPRMPSGEGFVRQHLYGQRFYLQHFGKIAEVAWFQDSFGYSIQMPQYSARSGCKYYFTNKIASNKETIFPTNAFYWHSPDGSSLLSYWNTGGFGVIPGWSRFKKGHRLLKPGKKLDFDYRVDKPEDLPVWSNDYVPVIGSFYGRGDGGHGPGADEWAYVRFMQESGKKVQPSLAINFYKQLEKVADRLPHFHDELYYEFHRATLTTHHLVKYMNRRMEWSLQGWETLAIIISKMTPQYRYPYERFTRLWKNACTLQMHDILPGSSIPEVYDDAWDCWTLFNKWGDEICGDLKNSLMKYAGIIPGLTGVLLINPLCVPRNDPITIPWNSPKSPPPCIIDEEGNIYPIQLLPSDPDSLEPLERRNVRLIFTIPLLPWGISCLKFGNLSDLSNTKPGVIVKVTEEKLLLSNCFYRLAIDKKTGSLLSLRLRGVKTPKQEILDIETLDGPSNIIQVFEDFLLSEPAWNYNPQYRKFPLDQIQSEGITKFPAVLIENGPVRWTIETKTLMNFEEHGTATFIQHVSIYAGIEGIECETLVDWHMSEASVKCFYNIAGDPQESISEVAYGTIHRLLYPTANHDKPRWENNMQTFLTLPAKDNSFCFNIINEGKYGYDNIEGHKIGISMIRGPRYTDVPGSSWIAKERMDRIKRGEGQPPDITDQGCHIIRLQLIPRRGSWADQSIEKAAHAFNCPNLTDMVTYKPFTWHFALASPPGIEIAALKLGEANNEALNNWYRPINKPNMKIIVLRVYETLGSYHNATIQLPAIWSVTAIEVADLIERPTNESSKIVWNQEKNIESVEITCKPHEIKTLLLETR
jgi:alpha-mannosidase